MELSKLGWNPYFDEKFKEYKALGCTPGRISIEHKGMYKLYTENGEIMGEISGKMYYRAESQDDLPAVGDWVAITERTEEKRATIHGIVQRKSKFARKVAGQTTREQIVASNVDTVFLVTSLNHNFNVRRMERYLILAWESGASPVIVLSKADLCDDIDSKIEEMESVAFGVPIHVVSSINDKGLDELLKYVTEGKTVALMGSSGVGKSTLINHLAGKELLKVQEISGLEDKGRHTTTHRELILLPGGGLIIDTPGMKEIQMWEGSEGIGEAFEDIETLAARCRFTDCRHENEPGCAVREAIRDGSIDYERLESYRKLQKEIRFMESKQNQIARIEAKNSLKTSSKKGRDNRSISSYDYA